MNIVLTGFMATGKSDVGKKIAYILKIKFVDTDKLIEKKIGMKISEIFAKKGERFFRDVESEIAETVSKHKNYIIATGGGIVLRQKNINVLKKNGKIVNLYASTGKILERVFENTDRPLLNVKDRKKEIQKLLKQRQPFYKKCDFSVNTTNTTPTEAAKKIIEKLGLKNP
ncbi:MAG: shikimate kinase [Elusimicrobiota bacterium]